MGPSFTQARTLVVDSNPSSRSLSCQQLRDMGIGELQQAARPNDVRMALERQRYDIVLCSIELNDPEAGWQDLFDELRREGLLPHSTVMFVITAEATYAKVREAAEAALDGYLLRPYNGATLAERLQQAWRRKQELAPLLEALRDGRDEAALAWCLECLEQRRRHAMFASRVACELLFKLDRPVEVVELCKSLMADEAESGAGAGGERDWVRLNTVRALHMRGEAHRARRMCDEFVEANSHNADALDLQTQLQAEAGELATAFSAARTAVQITPGCVLRLQTCGALAFYAGESALVLQMLTRAVSLGLRSRLFDALSLAFLGLVQYDQGESKYLPVTRSHLSHYLRRHEGSVRLQRFDVVLASLRHLQLRETDSAAAEAGKLAAQTLDDNYDLEAAVLTLALWARIPSRELEAKRVERMVLDIGLRHSSIRASHEALLASAQRQPQIMQILESAHQQVLKLAEESMARSLAGQPLMAVQVLLEHGQRWRNTKLLEMAVAVARRHAVTVGEEGSALAQQALQHLEPLSRNTTHIAGLRRTGRSAGGLIMRR